ncbi:ligand-binding SRPBCC domain-containing protein [Nocardiopsis arvandica]|uniref:Ligand-binding SRPBCC domain-containing protein n=1 Tax=Nocardiopsis sinuspersici TaxID=501010 RepID=A0A7Y9XBN8_9ACTN|nr:SRPBCC family protein [Nocardiopsis sinuspersici]NYH52821.1 ligand-binding SRPBCC domain-containing protein [Nocardiopsis sinuspersici]
MAGRETEERGFLSGPRTTERPRSTSTAVYTALFDAPSDRVFSFCTSRSGFEESMPSGVEVLRWPGRGFAQGEVMVLRWRLAGVLPVRWVGVIESFEDGVRFTDLQLRGLFRYFRHTHSVEPKGAATAYTDRVEFASRLGPAVDRTVLRPVMDRMFLARLARMRELLEGGA